MTVSVYVLVCRKDKSRKRGTGRGLVTRGHKSKLSGYESNLHQRYSKSTPIQASLLWHLVWRDLDCRGVHVRDSGNTWIAFFFGCYNYAVTDV